MKKLLVVLLVLPFLAFADDGFAPAAPPTTQSQATSGDLQSSKHYTNSDGQVVHSQTKTASGKSPDGANAKCGDGSFSKHRSGTCTHHSGVVN